MRVVCVWATAHSPSTILPTPHTLHNYNPEISYTSRWYIISETSYSTKIINMAIILFNYFRVVLYFTFDPAAVQCWLVDRTCGGSWDGNDLCTLRGQADECEKWCWWWVCEGVPASTRHETTRVARANQQGVRGVWCGGVVCVGVWCVWGVWCGG